jgi:hypothetical protein
MVEAALEGDLAGAAAAEPEPDAVRRVRPSDDPTTRWPSGPPLG